MNSLLLFVSGASEEEIQENGLNAIDEAINDYKLIGNDANCLCPDRYEFEFVPYNDMSSLWQDIFISRLKDWNKELTVGELIQELERLRDLK